MSLASRRHVADTDQTCECLLSVSAVEYNRVDVSLYPFLNVFYSGPSHNNELESQTIPFPLPRIVSLSDPEGDPHLASKD